ncbi:MAG: DNA primase [Calditerrivibrio sp.]|nr:DNA primase [Calditerrivibrio sp.]
MGELKDIILERIDIADYISQYVDLKKNGSSYRGLCPFHYEKTPSFYVTPSKRLFHCFGCGSAGNVITFAMKYHNLSFTDALKMLAAKAGIEFEKKMQIDKGLIELKRLHYDISVVSQEMLLDNIGTVYLDYLKKRGFDEKDIVDFSLGFIPDGYNFSGLLKKYSYDIIKKSGLFYYRDGQDIFKFSGRLLIPIRDIFGEIVAFSGRDIMGAMPKYINSPETPIFKKGSLLYNLNKAREHSLKLKTMYIVEGYFDVIRMWKHGYMNVVSSMGTAFTYEHAQLVKRYAENPIVIFDGDQAGVNAALKILEPFISVNTIPEVVFLPEGEDPDTFLRDRGEQFEEVLLNKKDLLIMLSERYAKMDGSLSRKVKIYESLVKKIEKFPESSLKSAYTEKLKTIFNINAELLVSKRIFKKDSKIKPKDLRYIYEDDFLASLFIIKDEELISNLIDGLSKEFFYQDKRGLIFEKIVDIMRSSGNIDTLFNDEEVGELVSYMVSQRNYVEPYKIAILNRNKLIYNHINKEKLQLQEQLKIVSDVKMSMEILKKIDDLTKEMIKYNKVEA